MVDLSTTIGGVKTPTARDMWGWVARGEVGLAVGVVGVIVLLILPVPAFGLDLLLALSISSAMLILMTALMIKKPLEFTAFPTVLLSVGSEIDETAIRLPDGKPLQLDALAQTANRAAEAADAATRTLVGQTVAEVEQQLILDTLSHCLGNRTHAATILGISIRTLRNKLKEYSESGVLVPAPQGQHAA